MISKEVPPKEKIKLFFQILVVITGIRHINTMYRELINTSLFIIDFMYLTVWLPGLIPETNAPDFFYIVSCFLRIKN